MIVNIVVCIMMHMHIQEILKSVRQRVGVKSRVTLSLDRDVYARFRKLCDAEGVHTSNVVEEFMRQCVEPGKSRTVSEKKRG